MRKIYRNPVFTFFLGTLLAGSTAYAAYKIHAREVSYTPENESFQVVNVNSALDSLYEKVGSGNLTLLDSKAHNPPNPLSNVYQDTITYTATEEGELLFVATIVQSGWIENMKYQINGSNDSIKLNLLGNNRMTTVTGSLASYTNNYVYKISNVSVGDTITLSASGTKSANASSSNTILVGYQVYKIG